MRFHDGSFKLYRRNVLAISKEVRILLRMDQQHISSFECPGCGSKYKLVRVEASAGSHDRTVNCRNCGEPLQARQDRFLLKYFLVERPRQRKRGSAPNVVRS